MVAAKFALAARLDALAENRSSDTGRALRKDVERKLDRTQQEDALAEMAKLADSINFKQVILLFKSRALSYCFLMLLFIYAFILYPIPILPCMFHILFLII